MKLLLVTDTHLGPRAAACNANWQAAQAWIADHVPDAVVHLGDISADGADDVDGLAFSAALLSALDVPLHALPGNHDVGDNSVPGVAETHRIDAIRLRRYRDAFGPDWWSLRTPHWLLLGLNAQLLGSDCEDEERQFDWIARTLAADVPAHIALLLHKPLFDTHPQQPEAGERYVQPLPRQRLLRLLAGHPLRLVVSGHTHQWRRRVLQGVEHVWVPSTSFCIPDAVQLRLGEKFVGLMQLTLDAAGYRFDTIIPAGMQRHNLLDQLDVYPQLAGIKQRLGAAGEL